jgi:predicted helicase
VAIYFLVRKEGEIGCRIHYNAVPDCASASEKKAYLRENRFVDLQFAPIHPDEHHNWLHLTENDWDELIPVASKEAKQGRGQAERRAIFGLFSLGVVTNRDEWVHDESSSELSRKVQFFIGFYNQQVDQFFAEVNRDKIGSTVDSTIKWTRAVKHDLTKGRKYTFDQSHIVDTLYRPFVKRKLYFARELNEMQYQLPKVFWGPNTVISLSGTSASKPFSVLATNEIFSLDLLEKTQGLPLYSYTARGERVDNVTDWALAQFQARYPDYASRITPQAIFHYVYAVLHHPAYRAKYERNLKREFPRIPFYDDFPQWAAWGKRLMALHLNYEGAAPYPLVREDRDLTGLPNLSGLAPKPRLIARKEAGVIEVDTITTLRGVPAEAWEYRLGTYSALEWILERYKERTPKDPTIREKFNTYRFSNYKEQVIDLLRRVCTVSVETMKIVRQMPE